MRVRPVTWSDCRHPAAAVRPLADAPEHDDGNEREERAPGEARLAVRQHEKRADQRSERRADVAADLKERLREAVLAARGHARDPRRFRVKDRRADAHQPGGGDEHAEGRRDREQQEPGERDAHAGDERVRHRPAIRVEADERLQQRCGQQQRERQQPDLREAEAEGLLEHGVQGGEQRLDRVVEEMRHADAGEHGKRRPARLPLRPRGNAQGGGRVQLCPRRRLKYFAHGPTWRPV